MTHKYRVESGPFVEIVETRDDGRIVAAPPAWSRFIGSPLNSLEWWLAACNQSCSKVRIPPAVDEVEVVDNTGKEVESSRDNPDFRRQSSTTLADVALPTYCGCNELLENIEQLEAHVERGCWRKA